uniref:Pentatricopeptide repeat-containing protein ELI1, chloroplastic-like n=1 Tax=Nicotiana tabacum TaxID=4097 RepID=A0A1S3X0E3_TOBAC|nr:PREDICTED: pentatricopeptide repeat-containing protein ELI1, chloroplastic-like [Nicotiana tabacum]
MYVATSMLNAYAGTSFDCAYKLFDEIPVRNTVTSNSVISCFSRSGDVKGTRKMFDQMPLRDLASWSAMIAGYMNNGHWEEGAALFQEMVIFEQLKLDQVTIGPILAGCSEICSIGLLLGKSVHGFVVKNHLELNVELGTCLVDMYAKCGFMNFASLVFDMMKDRNVVTWTALICGAAKHGFGTESLKIFKKMRQGGVLPNEFTFTGVLCASVQAGLVNEGRGYFKMTKECGLRPTIQHCGCMVELFGKAGLLGEAYEVINTMSPEPIIVIWGSFLSSCKLHKQFEMAERVIEMVINVVRPENDGGVYTLISDLYVLGDKWAEAERVRQLMLHQHVRKARGSKPLGQRVGNSEDWDSICLKFPHPGYQVILFASSLHPLTVFYVYDLLQVAGFLVGCVCDRDRARERVVEG